MNSEGDEPKAEAAAESSDAARSSDDAGESAAAQSSDEAETSDAAQSPDGAAGLPRLVVITGTTGSGKNSLATSVAERIGAEIVSLDSMKVYRGMDIGTAKPDPSLRERVPHHMLDILDPTERIDMRAFVDRAMRSVEDIRARGRRVVCVGGTAMYLNGLVYGFHEGPSRDPKFRSALQKERDEVGVEVLHARLQKLDPKAAGRIDPNDYQRIERALEVATSDPQPLGERQKTWFKNPRFDLRLSVVTWPREILRQRIDDRVDAMLDGGWVEEIRRIEEGGGFSDEASMAIGYREIRAWLAEGAQGELPRKRIKTKTWQFARRQLTWMKKYAGAEFVVRDESDDRADLINRLVARAE